MSKKAKIYMCLCPNCKTIQRANSKCPLCGASIPPALGQEKEEQKKHMEFVGGNLRIEFCKLALPGQKDILPVGYRAHLRIDCSLVAQVSQTQPILGPPQEQPSFGTEELEGVGLVAPPTPGYNPLQHAFQTYLYDPKSGLGSDLPLGYGDTLRFQVPDAEGNVFLYDVTYQPDNKIKIQELEQRLYYGTATAFDTWDAALEALPGREILPMGHFARQAEYNDNKHENPYTVRYEKSLSLG